MKAPVKVLIFWIAIAVALVVVVFYRYNIIEGIKIAINNPQQSNLAVEKPVEQAVQQTASIANNNVAPQSLVNGKKLYEEKTCVLCHGADGKADSVTGQAMKATNLTLGTFHNNKNNLEATAYVLNVLENGVPGTAMVSFKAQIPNEQDRKDLADFVVSLSNKK